MNKKREREVYNEYLGNFQFTLSELDIDNLKIMRNAFDDYCESRFMCEIMCGGVEDDCDI